MILDVVDSTNRIGTNDKTRQLAGFSMQTIGELIRLQKGTGCKSRLQIVLLCILIL